MAARFTAAAGSFAWDSCLPGDGAQVFDDRHDERHTVFAAFAFCFAFRIAGNERAIGAGSGLCGAEDADIIVDLALEDVGFNEAVDAHSAEEMANAFAYAAQRNFLAQGEGWSKRAPVRSAE